MVDPLKPLRWAVGDARGVKGRKETGVGAEADEVPEVLEGEEEEGVRRGRGEAPEALCGHGWLGLEGPKAGDAVRAGNL